MGNHWSGFKEVLGWQSLVPVLGVRDIAGQETGMSRVGSQESHVSGVGDVTGQE